MRKSRKKRPTAPLTPQFKSNEKIKAETVRLIDENREMVGEVETVKALKMAEEAGLDLVEVSPKATPPVCKIMDLGSFKYQKEKEAKAQKLKQKAIEIKGIRISLRIGEHDRDVRVGRAKKFLENNDKVKIEMMLKGRERQHLGQGREALEAFVKELGDVKIEQPFTKQGGKLSIVVTPK